MDEQSSQKTLPAPTANGKGKTLAISALVVAIASSAFFQFRVEMLSRDNAALDQHLTLLSSQYQAQLQQGAKQQQTLGEYEKHLTAMQGHVNFMSRTLDQIPGAKVDDWKLAEVEYLLRLANQRIILQQELSGAHALLDSANQILGQLDDPSLLNIRQQLAKEMRVLGSFVQLDRQGMYMEIQALKSAIPNAIHAPKNFDKKPKESSNTVASQPVNENESLGAWDTIKQQFLSLVRIRHNEQAFNESLTDSQFQLLEHSLILMLEQAQWALLKADNELFKTSLENAANWIERNLRHSQADTVLADITKLAKVDITQHMPDISKSLNLLRQALKNRTYEPSPIKKANVKNTTEKTKISKPAQPKSTPPVKKAPAPKKQEQA